MEEVVALLAARAPKLRPAVRDAKKVGLRLRVLDGTLIPVDRVAADRPFYSGKHKRHGMNLQVIASPGGDILWVSGALPGSVHDKKAEWIWGVLAELEAAGLITLADKGYQGSAYAKIPYRGKNKPESQKQANRRTRNSAHPASARTPSSRPGEFSASSAAAPGAPVSSRRPSTYCRSARHNQDGKVQCRGEGGACSLDGLPDAEEGEGGYCTVHRAEFGRSALNVRPEAVVPMEVSGRHVVGDTAWWRHEDRVRGAFGGRNGGVWPRRRARR